MFRRKSKRRLEKTSSFVLKSRLGVFDNKEAQSARATDLHNRPFHSPVGRIPRSAARSWHRTRCRRPYDPSIAPQSAIQSRNTRPQITRRENRLCPHRQTRWPEARTHGLQEYRLAQFILSRLCRLHAGARIRARASPPDRPRGPEKIRHHVCGGSAVALSSFAHCRCAHGPQNSRFPHSQLRQAPPALSHTICKGPWSFDYLPDV